MRRLLVVNALIFAVLAAAVALAYYGYNYATTEGSSGVRLRAMQELAEEKVLNIEGIIVADDRKLFDSSLPLDAFIAELPNLTKDMRAMSMFVLDGQRKLVPSSYYSHRPAPEGLAFRDWFLRAVLPDLPLAKLQVHREPDDLVVTRGHLHAIWDGRPYLFSFVKKVSGDKTYYIVLEEDLANLVAFVFPQYFPRADSKSKRIYQVVDDSGAVIYGLPIEPEKGALQIDESFADTVDMWRVRVTEPDVSYRKEEDRKRLIDSVFIGGAVALMLSGLLVLVIAIRRERRANELKSEFISNVSHELKTPLSIISMFGEMLAHGRTKGPEQATEYADIIWRESVRLGRLIDNVLDFAKIERGKSVYEFADTDVGEVVERAIDLVGRRLTSADMSVDVDIEPELPLVQLDANAFTLAVMNLIDNATKYAADGKKIELKLQRQGDRIVLTVRDFGPGIDPEEQEQIFERFYRARAVRLKPIRGSGIGLALVRHIARAHHGDVSVESTPGNGATFQLWLPIEV